MIKENAFELLKEIPSHVSLVVAAKGRTVDEVQEVVEAGVKIIGENYVQEAQKLKERINADLEWHFIGHLQKNKVSKAVALFDMIETVDSLKLAEEINAACKSHGKKIPILIEINSGKEAQKHGVMPDEAEAFIGEIAGLAHLEIMGLMTMGPFCQESEAVRPYFKATKELFENIKGRGIKGAGMKHLSMGMSDTYRIAIDEGATMVRVGSKIFGPRAQ